VTQQSRLDRAYCSRGSRPGRSPMPVRSCKSKPKFRMVDQLLHCEPAIHWHVGTSSVRARDTNAAALHRADRPPAEQWHPTRPLMLSLAARVQQRSIEAEPHSVTSTPPRKLLPGNATRLNSLPSTTYLRQDAGLRLECSCVNPRAGFAQTRDSAACERRQSLTAEVVRDAVAPRSRRKRAPVGRREP